MRALRDTGILRFQNGKFNATWGQYFHRRPRRDAESISVDILMCFLSLGNNVQLRTE